MAASLNWVGKDTSQEEACRVEAWDKGTYWVAYEVASYEWADTYKAGSRGMEDSRSDESLDLRGTCLPYMDRSYLFFKARKFPFIFLFYHI